MDEDGQHDPNQIGIMLHTALAERADLVYAAPLNSPPHGFVRNLASKASKQVLETVFGGGHALALRVPLSCAGATSTVAPFQQCQ